MPAATGERIHPVEAPADPPGASSFWCHLGGLNGNLTRPFRRWIDHIANLSNFGGGKAAHLRVLADDGLIRGEINTKRFIVRDVAFEPLNIGAKLVQHPVRFLCRSAELFALEGSDLWNIPFDDELA